ncbi:MAG TPA: histidine kinase dimerization/phosphoacceptor domain -containing protein [Hyphomonadaceae bacterium]|nr:histidine kinase dimerization/phosphoacceptor domain -containing protein [Hyphomonadaceae bacterium]
MTSDTIPQADRPGGVRAAIGLLLLIPILAPLFAAMVIWFSERDSTRIAEDRATAAVKVSAANVRLLIESTLDRLHRLDDALGPDPAKFRPVTLPGGPKALELFDGFYNANGDPITRTGTGGANVADNADFQALKNGKPWRITALIRSSSLRLFGIGRRIERNGQFAGVITAYLQADALTDTWNNVNLGADSTLGLIRDDGWVITRYPVPEEGINLAGYELFTIHLRQAPAGLYQGTSSPVDGHKRLVAYQSLKDLGVIVVASISQTQTIDAFWSRVRSTALVAGPVFLALLVLCVWTALLLQRKERSRVELTAALAQNRVLLQEIHHRVKNNLQAVAAMVRLQAAPPGMKEDLTRRIAAMTAVHQHMYESDQFGDLDAAGYLGKLLASLRDSAPPGVDLSWHLNPVRVSPDQALPLGLIVNEVVANAFKHAFPEGRPGKVEVSLSKVDGLPEALLVIEDNGVGVSEAAAPGGVGLGTRLIASLAAQLEGKSTQIRSGGVRFELRFPLEDIKAR